MVATASAAERWAARLVRMSVSWVPALSLSAALAAGRAIGFLLGRVARYRREEAAAALRHAFPAMRAADVRRTLDEMYENFGLTLAESLWITPARLPAYLAEHVVAPQVTSHAAQAEGRGLLILTAHAGNFDLLCRCAPAFGFPLTIIAKHMRNRAIDAWIRRHWAEFGVEVLPPRGSFRSCLRALRHNGVVGFMLDQNMTRDEGVFVEFFGRPACTTPGLAHLAARSGAPVIPTFIERAPAGRHVIWSGEPLPPPAAADPDGIREATQMYTRVIEDWIRAHPGQWTWIHRRWRTTPGEAPAA